MNRIKIVRMRKIWSFYIASLVLISCVDNNDALQEGIIIDMDNAVQEKSLASFFDSIQDLQIVPLAYNSNLNISTVSHLKMYDKTYYFIDARTKAINCCNSSGDLVFSIKRHGRGPGEYMEITSYCIVDQELYVLDRVNQKILIYSSEDGTYRNSINVTEKNDYSNLLINDQSILMNARLLDYPIYGNSYALHKFDMSGNYQCEYLEMARSYVKRVDDYRYLSDLYAVSDTVHFSLPMRNTVYEFYNDKVSIKYRFDFGNNDIERFITRRNCNNSPEEFEEDLKEQRIAYMMAGIAESPSYLVSYFNKGDGIYLMVLDKKSRDVKVFPKKMQGIYYLMGADSKIYYLGDDVFATIIDPLNFCPLPEIDVLDGASDNVKDVYSKIRKINPGTEDNPMLLTFKI